MTVTTRDEIEAAVDELIALARLSGGDHVAYLYGRQPIQKQAESEHLTLEARAALLALVSMSCEGCRHLGSDEPGGIVACRYCPRNAIYHDHWEATP